MAFPFLFLSVSLVVGILFSRILFSSMPVYTLALAVSLSFAWFFYFLNRIRVSFILILVSVFFLGADLHTLADKNFDGNSLHKFKSKAYVDFYGILYKSPSKGKEKDYLYLRVRKVLSENREQKITGNLRVSVPHTPHSPSLTNLFVGDRVKVSARVLSSQGFSNFHDFSLDSYLKSQKIHNRASTKSPLLIEKLKSGDKTSPLRWISILRQNMQAKIEEHFRSSDSSSLSAQGAILEALLLGERGRMDDVTNRSLQKAGIYHLFAISGAHIAIISFILFLLFRGLQIPSRLSYLILMGVLIFYAFLVEGRPSVMRATIMTLAFLLGKILWSNVNLINTISISAFLLLFANPFNLFHVGFQLTFAATFSIILFFPRIIKYFPRLPLRISEIFVISLTAQLGVLPIAVFVFHRVTFSSLLLNFIGIPLVGIIMSLGYVFLFLSFISTFLGQITAQAIGFLIDLLTISSHLLDWIPSISYRIPSPHLVVLIGYYFFLLMLLLKPRIKTQKLIFLLSFITLFGILVSYPFRSTSKNLKLTLIDVGQGESILVEFPGRVKMLIDGGGLEGGTFDIGERVVSPFLWHKGIKRIDYIVLTHAHPDHMNGLRAVSRNFKIGEFWEAYSPTEDEAYSGFRRQLPPSLIKKRVFRGDSHQEGSILLEVLHPERRDPHRQMVDNDQSVVLRLSHDRITFLLPGDISEAVEREILGANYEIKSHLLKSPHHGSITSSSKDFIQRVNPQIVIISAGVGNTYGVPHPEVLERYREVGARVYRTDLHGAIEVSSDGKTISIRTAR